MTRRAGVGRRRAVAARGRRADVPRRPVGASRRRAGDLRPPVTFLRRWARFVAKPALALACVAGAVAGPARAPAVAAASGYSPTGPGATPAIAPEPARAGATELAGTAASRADPARAAAAPEQQAAVELVDQPAWVLPGERYDVRVQVTGAPADATIDMVVHQRLDSREEFRHTLEGDLGGNQLTVDAQPLAGAAVGPGGAVTVGFAPDEPGTRLPSRGVYPVEVRVTSAAGDVVGSVVTYLTYLKSEAPGPPIDVAVLVDIAAPPTLMPDGTYTVPAGALDDVADRVDVLRETPDLPLTLAPLPETLEGLYHGGEGAAAVAEDLRVAAGRRPVFARPFVDVDLAALQRAGLVFEANAQAEGGANVIRNRLAIEPTGGMWLSGPTFGADAARLAVDLGIDRAVVPPSAVAAEDGEPVPVPLAPVRLNEDGPIAMVSDPELAAHLTGDGMVAAHRFLAELAITWLEAPADQRGIVVHLPPEADIDPEVVSMALGALADSQPARVVPVDQLFDISPLADGPNSLPLAPHEIASDLRPLAPVLESARSRVTGVGEVLGDPAVTSSLAQSLLLGTGSATPDADRQAYVDRTRTALDSVQGAVTLPDEFRITLTSRSSTIPVALENASDQELTVRVELDSDQLEFPEGTELEAVLAPGTTRLEVPVRARTSGAFTLQVTVTSTDGSVVLDRSTFDIRSTAISGVGLVLSVGAGLFLVIWWAGHWRRTRRSRALMPPDEPSGTGVDAGGGRPGTSGSGVAASPPPDDDAHYRPAHMAGHRSRS